MSDLWDTWVGAQSPADFLRRVDRAVADGEYRSRQDAFIAYVRRAMRAFPPDAPMDCRPEALAQELLEYAESSEIVGP